MSYGSLPHHRGDLYIHIPTSIESRNRRSESRLIEETISLISISYRKSRSRDAESLLNWKIFLLSVIFISGVLIGVRLLFVEYEEMSSNFPYYLIELKTWYRSKLNYSENVTRLHLPVKNVIITQTMSEHHCITIRSCSMLINNMITNDLFDIPFNFMISSRGDTYEIRGWNYESGFANLSKNESVAIAFIGNYTMSELGDSQLAEIEAFISEAIRRRQLLKDFNIFGIENSEAIFYKLFETKKEWKGFL